MTSANAIIYARISKDRAGAGLGVERQTEDCLALAERLGWTVLRAESDNDISAYSGKRRPGYERTLAALESGEASAVVAWHSDRLHRRNVELERFIDVVERTGAQVATVQSGPVDLASPSGRMQARILGAVSAHEIEHLTERIRAEKRQALTAGTFRGGLRPFGYERDGLTLRPVEADLVRRAIADVTTGKPLRAVAREWTQAGHLTTLGKAWTAPSMKVTLTRWRNAGLVELDGEPAGAAQWEAIVTEDELRAVRAVLADPSRRTSRGNQRKYQGSGIYIDDATGHPMKAGMSNRVEPQAIYRADPRGPGSATADADELDEYVSAAICARLSAPDARELLAAPEVDTRGLSGQREALDARLREAAGLFSGGAITGAQLTEITADLRAQIDTIDTQLDTATADPELAALLRADDVRAAWDGPNGLHMDTRARLIKSLARVTISPMTTKGVRRTFKPECVDIEWL
ncbi:recombinase family protein [Tsukamurella strandjordii]|uniref:Recombinase family protein n=1 Tax=Tsukamurella strandjordii TaxID=147577 RepID=A0AA90NHF6_9ACTN|nr:recombinase family protein [Tsukamurella strandjordii]MDP0399178.1 recombinase family protein [Tsukamurella strandjordii]